MTIFTSRAPGFTTGPVPTRSPGWGIALPDFDTRASTRTEVDVEIFIPGAIAMLSSRRKSRGRPVAGPRKTDPSVWRQILDVNLTGAFLGARAATRVMGEGGRLIFTGSVLGERPREGLAAYSASKAGLVGLAKALALDLAAAGITVNVVAPGWFDSPLVEPWKNNAELGDRVLAHTAQRRWGAPDELVGAYQFLASDSSAFVTGTVLTVDGGYLLV